MMNQFLVYCSGLGRVVFQAPYTCRYTGCNLAELHMIAVYIKMNFIFTKRVNYFHHLEYQKFLLLSSTVRIF